MLSLAKPSISSLIRFRSNHMKKEYETRHVSEEVKSTERCIRPYRLKDHQRSHSDYIVTIKKSENTLASYSMSYAINLK
jgi:hypothetical protein